MSRQEYQGLPDAVCQGLDVRLSELGVTAQPVRKPDESAIVVAYILEKGVAANQLYPNITQVLPIL